ncbi:MAG: hypothetical protein A4E32_00350 [Methanomassiliicoccales archaeon PtaU1.Bin124]|nr:MAG: hypothetical protein A4E32_00350 [Methanomassiliicoccales archaeon PtaU1.Bin124]
MKWRTHAAITRTVGDSLGMEPELIEVMVEASIEPDRCPVGKRNNGRFSRSIHHGTESKIVKILVWKARMAFLEGDVHSGSRALGLALHYVQDNSVPRCRNWNAHKEFERRLSEQVVPMNAIRSGLERSISSPLFVDAVADSVRPRKNRQWSMYQASACSAALAGAVLSDLDPPGEMAIQLRRRLLAHRYVAPPLIIGLGAAVTTTLWTIWPAAGLTALSATCILFAVNSTLTRRTNRLEKWFDIL